MALRKTAEMDQGKYSEAAKIIKDNTCMDENVNNIKFERFVQPTSVVGDPSLVIFSDGSDNAHGACAANRNPIISKNRLAPAKRMSIDRIGLCGAVLNRRLKKLLEGESRYHFSKCFHIGDSEIVHSMVQKESYCYKYRGELRGH